MYLSESEPAPMLIVEIKTHTNMANGQEIHEIVPEFGDLPDDFERYFVKFALRNPQGQSVMEKRVPIPAIELVEAFEKLGEMMPTLLPKVQKEMFDELNRLQRQAALQQSVAAGPALLGANGMPFRN